MVSRREFLRTASLIAVAPAVPAFLARAASATPAQTDGSVLVVLQLDGGNDGINTVVPFADEGYARYRKVLRMPEGRLLKLDGAVAFHSGLREFRELFDKGQLAVIQGVGYPNPNRSHFRSMAIWHTARLDPEQHADTGWLGRAVDLAPQPPGGTPSSLFVGREAPPVALRGRRVAVSSLARLEDFLLALEDPRRAYAAPAAGEDVAAFVRGSVFGAYATAGKMAQVARLGSGGLRAPAISLAERLRLITRLLKAGSGARIFYTIQSGYDTHGAQEAIHGELLSELAGALKTFFDDLAEAQLADRVAVLCFSEFGRRVEENASGGTDHGTAGPVFLAGMNVRGGLVGKTPSLMDLEDGDLKVGIDFRQVYSTVLEDWLGLPCKPVLGGAFNKLALLRK